VFAEEVEGDPEEAMSQISMSIAFLSGFALVGVHTHMLLHLSLGATGLAMVAYVINVILGLFLNLWFMAGQVSPSSLRHLTVLLHAGKSGIFATQHPEIDWQRPSIRIV
jgi:hypothetical protein